MSADSQTDPSSSQGRVIGGVRPTHEPRYPSSIPTRCLTRPSRLVPDGTSGRRTSYSERPSSALTTSSRDRRRWGWRWKLRGCAVIGGAAAGGGGGGGGRGER